MGLFIIEAYFVFAHGFTIRISRNPYFSQAFLLLSFPHHKQSSAFSVESFLCPCLKKRNLFRNDWYALSFVSHHQFNYKTFNKGGEKETAQA